MEVAERHLNIVHLMEGMVRRVQQTQAHGCTTLS